MDGLDASDFQAGEQACSLNAHEMLSRGHDQSIS